MKSAAAIFIVFAGLVCVFSCRKESNTNVDFKYSYFPVDSGHYIIYDCDSITFDNFYTPTLVDTVHFQLMELVQSLFLDNSGRSTDVIERFRRNDSTSAWTALNLWTAIRTTTDAERFENNLRFIKLIFPPNVGTSWAGNAYLDISDTSSILWLANWNYQITALDVPYSINGFKFDSTLTVLQDSSQNLIQYTYGKEIYARNVGLIYQQLWNLTKNVQDSFPAGSNSGFIYTEQIRGYHL